MKKILLLVSFPLSLIADDLAIDTTASEAAVDAVGTADLT